MNYNLLSITNGEFSDELIADIKDFCDQIQSKLRSRADQNMVVIDYQNKPNSLLYNLLIEKRFLENQGIFNLLYQNNKLISLSGAYKSDFDSRVVIGGVRTYTLTEYRNSFHHSEYILPAQLAWAEGQGAEVFCLTFNYYNKWLVQFIERANINKAIVFGKPIPKSLIGFVKHEKLVKIKATEQILLKKYLINNSTVNFSAIEIQ